MRVLVAAATLRAVALALAAALLLAGCLAPAAAQPCALPERAVAVIVSHEIGSEALYRARYTRPLWPGAASGVTIGIGYDLGHRAANIIRADWWGHPQLDRLPPASGVTGPPARTLAATMRDVVTGWPIARAVFDQTSLIEHCRIARRVFGARHFDALPGLARGALVSLVFNRGGSMVGPKRVEMRAIRDRCVPAQDLHCIAGQLRAMAELWRGTDIERGMRKRRGDEARLVETAA